MDETTLQEIEKEIGHWGADEKPILVERLIAEIRRLRRERDEDRKSMGRANAQMADERDEAWDAMRRLREENAEARASAREPGTYRFC